MKWMCLEPPGRIWDVSVGSRKIKNPSENNIEKNQKIRRWLMGPVRDPYVVVSYHGMGRDRSKSEPSDDTDGFGGGGWEDLWISDFRGYRSETSF